MRQSELKRTLIGVISGGDSPEREVSIKTGRTVLSALRRLGYRAKLIMADKNLAKKILRMKVGVVFNALHGGLGENGCVQGMLEVLGIPYTGSGLLASAVCMDKIKTKEILTANKIPTPPYFVISEKNKEYVCLRKFPVVVKPSDAGSSIGVTIVYDRENFSKAVKNAFKYSKEIIVEDFIPGKEVTVAILDDRALGAMEVVPKEDFLSYRVKYTPGLEDFKIPPPLPQKTLEKVIEFSEKAHRVLGCRCYSRVDTRVTSAGKVYILEVNTLPGLTELSYLPKIAEWRGLSYDSLINRILLDADLKGR